MAYATAPVIGQELIAIFVLRTTMEILVKIIVLRQLHVMEMDRAMVTENVNAMGVTSNHSVNIKNIIWRSLVNLTIIRQE